MSANPQTSGPPSLRRIGPGMAGLFSFLVFLSLPLVPLVGLFLGVLAPLPLLQIAASRRPAFMAWGWVAVILAGGVLVTSEAWLAALTLGYLLLTVWPVVAVETWLRRHWSEGRFFCVTVGFALVVAAAALAAAAYPAFPPDQLAAQVAASWAEVGGMPGWLTRLASEGRDVDVAVRLFAYLVPALTALYVMAVAAFLRPRLRVLGLPAEVGAFAEYRSEEWLPAGFVLGGLGWVLLPEPGKWLAANLLIIVAGLFFMHGLAIIHFYLGPRLRPNRWIRAGVLILALQMPVAVMLAVAGLADSFVRLRRGGDSDEGSEQ